MGNYDKEEEDTTPGLNDEYTLEETDKAMQEMECWQVENHLKSCDKHKTS